MTVESPWSMPRWPSSDSTRPVVHGSTASARTARRSRSQGVGTAFLLGSGTHNGGLPSRAALSIAISARRAATSADSAGRSASDRAETASGGVWAVGMMRLLLLDDDDGDWS